jgi:hypothetical protein
MDKYGQKDGWELMRELTDAKSERINKMVNIEEVNIEEIVEDFIRDLQWDLRDSYNSSSCLGSKQRDFLKEKLYDLLIVLKKERKE